MKTRSWGVVLPKRVRRHEYRPRTVQARWLRRGPLLARTTYGRERSRGVTCATACGFSSFFVASDILRV